MASIFVQADDAGINEFAPARYEKEADLQAIVAAAPRILNSVLSATDDIRWMLVKREFRVPGSAGKYRVDALFLDQDGVPVLAEVKRASDARIRREIIGQLVDYIHNFLEHITYEHLSASLREACAATGITVADAIDKISPGLTAEEYWEQVKQSLADERLNVAVIADEIPNDLKKNISRLNKSWPTVNFFAFEVQQYVSKDSRIRLLVPKDCSTEVTPPAQPELPTKRSSVATAATRPLNWEEAILFTNDCSMHPTLLAEANSHGGSVSVRKIYYKVDGQNRWRLQIQKSGVNAYQFGRFENDLQTWRTRLPELKNDIRTPDEGKQLSFTLRDLSQLQRFLDFAHAAERNEALVDFLPSGAIGESA